jgi:hypothetical protein
MIELGIAACSSMESFEFGDVLFAVGLIVGAIGLRALMLAYLGTLAFRLPRRGRPLTVAFTKAIPLSILAWLVLGLTLALASEQTDVTFQGTCKLPGDYSLMVVDADGSGWVYKAGNEIKGGDVKWQRMELAESKICRLQADIFWEAETPVGFDPRETAPESANIS